MPRRLEGAFTQWYLSCLLCAVCVAHLHERPDYQGSTSFSRLVEQAYLAASKTRRAAQARLEPACARYGCWSTPKCRAQARSAQTMTSCFAKVRQQRRRSQRAQISERKSRPIASNGSLYSLPIPSACVVRAHRSCRDRSLHMVGSMHLAGAAPGQDAVVQLENLLQHVGTIDRVCGRDL